MRAVHSDILALLRARSGYVSRVCVWLSGRNRSTGEIEYFGMCNEADEIQVQIGSQLRTYLGAGEMLQPEPVTSGTGLDVRTYQVNLAAASDRVEAIAKGYDTRFSPVEVHRVFYDPITRAQVGQPDRVFRGLIDGIEFPRPVPGDAGIVTISCVSETRALTRKLSVRKSAAAMEIRSPDDGFRKYAAVSGAVDVFWGSKREGS